MHQTEKTLIGETQRVEMCTNRICGQYGHRRPKLNCLTLNCMEFSGLGVNESRGEMGKWIRRMRQSKSFACGRDGQRHSWKAEIGLIDCYPSRIEKEQIK